VVDRKTNLEAHPVAAYAQSTSDWNKIHATRQQGQQQLYRWADYNLELTSLKKLKASNLNSSTKYTHSQVY